MDDRPDQLRDEIEQTRRELRRDADALNEKINPGRIVGRRVERTRHTMTRVKERVMGTAGTGTSAVRDVAGKAADTAGSAGSAIADTAKAAPGEIRGRTEGNPLAAGVIAFSAGWLLAGLLPATGKEKQLAETVEDMGGQFAEPVKQEVAQIGRDMKDGLEEPARQTVDEVRDTVKDAAGAVRDEGHSATQDVAGTTRNSAETIRDSAMRGSDQAT
jgi:gas vesicle protein